MTERNPRIVVIAAAMVALLALAYFAYTRPGYFTQTTYVGAFLVVEALIAAVWLYRRVFFPLLLVSFLFAGVDLPVGGGWNVARWVFLGTGALVGCFIMLKERNHRFGMFHVLAVFAVLAALVSAAVSLYPDIATLKAASLFLLFVYGSTGARLAVMARENRFFEGLLIGCEGFVGVLGILYSVGIEMMGNPNSLGAVTSVAAPILLWGVLLEENSFVRRRRWVLYGLCMYLAFHSHARAGMAAAVVSCGLLCFALRRYKLLFQGAAILLILAAASAILDPPRFSDTVSRLAASVVYKEKDPALGVLSSRISPWQAAVDTLRTHFWFGTGFGTSDTGLDASEHLGKFSSSAKATTENGSSYLAIVAWVGMLGVVPFAMMLAMLVVKIVRTLLWMRRSGNPAHPAIPLAMVLLAGMVHATFEDWMFAVGYHLCVFFWSLAFVFVDLAPSRPLPEFAFAPPPGLTPRNVVGVSPSL